MPDNETEGRMRPSGWRVPLAVAAAAAVLCYLLVGQAYGSIPPLPWTAIPTLLLLAAGEGIAAYHTRRRIRRAPGTEPVEPLSAARLVALAKASVLVAAFTGGAFAGTALFLAGRLTAPLPRQDFTVSTGSLAAAVVLLIAAYLLEWSCRVPDEEDRDNGPGPA
ncbi:DUF3180 domain-containing protein [Nocardiopsis composta]|uniref:DUF3180 domain-containing protein n=1 Tax=Nocardiopsis composta TaxID=157465 RepID=A0A7W8QPE8_9ACTN|nr:DUF3180 domain-containing protein [Nocardiopsis composta]MBB5433176.1 hypothetical protein [Nocardiopsis composta]